MISEKTYNKNQDKILKSIITNIYDLDKDQLFDLHLSFCINAYFSMQSITKQDLSEELIEKHKLLSRKIQNKKKNKNG